MTHFEVHCPECVGGINQILCLFECNQRTDHMIQKVEHIVFYYRCTCTDCSIRWDCEFAYDRYNTEGDCLDEK
jgi:hypothetical protein